MTDTSRLVNWYPVPEGNCEKGHNPERSYVAFDTNGGHLSNACAEMPAHGHVKLTDEGMVGTVPFPCMSQEGVHRLLALLVAQRVATPCEAEVFRGVAEVQQLPVALTDTERKIFADERQMAFFLKFAFGN